jgi:hypothetical protein
LRIALGEAIYFIVRAGNCLAQPARHRPRLLAQPVFYGVHRMLGGNLACSFASHSIHNHKYASLGFAENAVLVVFPFFPGVSFPPGFPGYGASRFLHDGYLERIFLRWA